MIYGNRDRFNRSLRSHNNAIWRRTTSRFIEISRINKSKNRFSNWMPGVSDECILLGKFFSHFFQWLLRWINATGTTQYFRTNLDMKQKLDMVIKNSSIVFKSWYKEYRYLGIYIDGVCQTLEIIKYLLFWLNWSSIFKNFGSQNRTYW